MSTASHNSGNLSRDSGGASCGTSSPGNGRTVQQSVGTLDFAWNQPSDSRHLNVLSYPQAAPFNGALQVHLEGPKFREARNTGRRLSVISCRCPLLQVRGRRSPYCTSLTAGTGVGGCVEVDTCSVLLLRPEPAPAVAVRGSC